MIIVTFLKMGNDEAHNLKETRSNVSTSQGQRAKKIC